jgi:hypothetical protein
MIYDDTKYVIKGGIPSEIASNLHVNWDMFVYEPILHLSDFWLLKKDMVPMNETVLERGLNLTLNFEHLGAYWYQY